ncbi:MAG TPA: Rid family detoxifying hydrolase [Myxococcaceae bacterium]|jgi:2-iminobutanoate/2-iminopropanoate deaminase|nr:Rid family detoxifying hydrolase [Myxococcaceae bacterium]
MREAIHGERPTGLPFSAGVRGPGVIYLSGQIGLDPSTGRLVPGDVASQTSRTLDNIRALLESVGSSLDDVLRVGVYLTSMEAFAAMNEVYVRYFRQPFPARTTVAVRELPMGAAVEIEMTVADRRT